MVPPGFFGATEAFDTKYASPDLEAAKAFLAASGYTEAAPLELTLWYPPEHYGASTAAWMQVIQKQLEATGAMKVTLQAQEWSTYIPALTGGESYNVGVMGWFFDYPDTSNYLDPFVYNRVWVTTATPPRHPLVWFNDEASQLIASCGGDVTDETNVLMSTKAQELYVTSTQHPLFSRRARCVQNNISVSFLGTPEL